MLSSKPFLKWAGGKQRLLPQYAPYFPGRFGRYFEPFLGGGAVFFHLRPATAFLSDLNAELVNTYVVVQGQLEALIPALQAHRNEKDYYYMVRQWDRPDGRIPLHHMSDVARAARFIYLNKTAFNGLWRVNSQGQHNVSFGSYRNPTICNVDRLQQASAALQGVVVQTADFRQAVAEAREGDLVFFDPPYWAGFTAYTGAGFGLDDHTALAHLFRALDKRGCLLMLSNSNTAVIRELYAGYRHVEIQARRNINCDGNGRGAVTELLITNYV